MEGAAARAFGTQARATAGFDAGMAAAARGGPAGHTVAGRRPLRRDWGGKEAIHMSGRHIVYRISARLKRQLQGTLPFLGPMLHVVR